MKKKIIVILSIVVVLTMNAAALAKNDAFAFEDVKDSHWASKYITELADNGIISGYEDNTFRPENPVTRAEWSKLLYAIDGSEPIICDNPNNAFGLNHSDIASDVTNNEWYVPYIYSMIYNGYINVSSLENGSYYYPEKEITREDVAVSIVKFENYDISKANLDYLKFSDIDNIKDKEYVAIAVEKKLISGFEDNTFRGQDTLTRAEAATLLWKITNINYKENYKGESSENIPNGKGTYLYPNGDKYEGNFSNGMLNGEGTYFYCNGDKYVGNWNFNKANGNGTYYFSNGTRYEGSWENSSINGDGTCFYSNNEKYEGSWHNNQKQGQGKYYDIEGNIYDGNWNNNRFNGDGSCYCANGDLLKGNFIDGVINGYGVYSLNSGVKYEGYFVNGVADGQGICYFLNNERYDGEWKNNMFNGQGKYYYSDGSRYEGSFVDSIPNGYGIYYSADGEVQQEGIFTND